MIERRCRNMKNGTMSNKCHILSIMEVDSVNSEICYQIPELLSSEKLISALRQRRVIRSEEDVSCFDKEALVTLFKKFILPLPQRKQLRRCQKRKCQKEMIKYLQRNSGIKRKHER